MCQSKPTSNNLELFIENLEKDLINPKNVKKFRHNITREEQVALKKVRNWDKQTIRIQDEESRFVILDNSDYEEKLQHQINRSSFEKFQKTLTKLIKKELTPEQKNGTTIIPLAENGRNL